MSRLIMLSIVGMLTCMDTEASLRRAIQRKLTFAISPDEMLVDEMADFSLDAPPAQREVVYGRIRPSKRFTKDCIKQYERIDILATIEQHFDILESILRIDETNVTTCMVSLSYILTHKKSFTLQQTLRISHLCNTTLAVAKNACPQNMSKLAELYEIFMQKNIVLI